MRRLAPATMRGTLRASLLVVTLVAACRGRGNDARPATDTVPVTPPANAAPDTSTLLSSGTAGTAAAPTAGTASTPAATTTRKPATTKPAATKPAAPPATKPVIEPVPPVRVLPKGVARTVKEVLDSPSLVGTTVRVEGRCIGYTQPVAAGAAPLTRSDWQLEDAGVAIWVSGATPPGCTGAAGSTGRTSIIARVAQDTLRPLGGGAPRPRNYLVRVDRAL